MNDTQETLDAHVTPALDTQAAAREGGVAAGQFYLLRAYTSLETAMADFLVDANLKQADRAILRAGGVLEVWCTRFDFNGPDHSRLLVINADGSLARMITVMGY